MLSRNLATQDKFAALLEDLIDTIHVQHVHMHGKDYEATDSLNTVLYKWLSLKEAGSVNVVVNNELVEYLAAITTYYSKSLKGQEADIPPKPFWWIDNQANSAQGDG